MLGTTNVQLPAVVTNSKLNISINGTNSLSYDGTTEKSLDITLVSLGAAASNHNHDDVYSKLTHAHEVLAFNNASLQTDIYGGYWGVLQTNTIGDGTGDWFNIIKILHSNPNGYYTELAQSFTGTDRLMHRIMNNGNMSNWKTVLDSSNYSNYTVPVTGGTFRGPIYMAANKINCYANNIPLLLRYDNEAYNGGIGWDSKDKECMAFVAKHTETHFKFKIGMDPSTFTNGSLSPTSIESEFDIGRTGVSTTGTITAKSTIASSESSVISLGGFRDFAQTMSVKPERANEVNFGGSTSSDVVYFGYRATDNKTIPKRFVFGGPSPGAADIFASAYYVSGTLATLPSATATSPNTKMLWTW